MFTLIIHIGYIWLGQISHDRAVPAERGLYASKMHALSVTEG